MNRYTATGNLTRDPELRLTGSGKAICAMRVAIDDMAGQGKPGYLNVNVWDAAGEACAKYLRKGSKVALDGRLVYEEWTKDDVKRNALSFTGRVEFLDGKPTDDDQPPASTDGLEPAGAGVAEDIPF